MDEKEESTRRRLVIHHSLRGVVTKPELATAMNLWHEEFAAEPSFQPMLFFKRFSQLVALDGRGAQIRSLLLQNMFKPLPDLGPEPSSDGGSSPAPATAASPPSAYGQSARSAVFCALLAAVVQETQEYSGLTQRLREALRNGIQGSGVSASAVQEVKAWTTSADSLIHPNLRSFQTDEMVRLIDQIYVLTCEYLGPKQADLLLGRALRQAERLPEARDFSPRQLL